MTFTNKDSKILLDRDLDNQSTPGGAIQVLGTKRHHGKWLRDTENYAIMGCFAMSEFEYWSTPCESAKKYWIGGAAIHATHTIVFSQLSISSISGNNQGVHALIAQIRDENGNVCPGVRIADCGHKIGLNGVDNGRIWFDNVRILRENLLNSVADVSPDGKYLSATFGTWDGTERSGTRRSVPRLRFAAFMAPLTWGRVTIAVSAISLAIAIRYSLTRRAFSVTPNGPEVLLLDYPSHQQRLLPLLAKTLRIFKAIHVVSSAFRATHTWHNMRTLQECREACGGQGLKTENRVGHLKSEYDVQSTYEGDNNVLLQQAQKRGKPFKALELEHMNKPRPVIPSQLTSSTLQERDLLNRFAMEVSQHQKQGESKEYSVIRSYQLAEDLGRAFSDRAMLQTFIDAEAALPAGSLKNVLALLRSMYAWICLEEDAAFLRYGYLSTNKVAAVRNEVSRLCGELRPHALALVSSFGIPDAFLSPIAFNWIHSNSWSSVEQHKSTVSPKIPHPSL
ncbi:unnamed protein product [Malus baccata var. baccata]